VSSLQQSLTALEAKHKALLHAQERESQAKLASTEKKREREHRTAEREIERLERENQEFRRRLGLLERERDAAVVVLSAREGHERRGMEFLAANSNHPPEAATI